jgi:hypothetical protein
MYLEPEIASLREALLQGLSGASAISMAREPRERETGGLEAALTEFDAPRADLLMDYALGVHSLERTVEDVLLGAIRRIARHHGTRSAVWAFASRWASDWTARVRRLLAPAGAPTLLLGDGVPNSLDSEALHLRTLELLLAGAGVRTVTLPVDMYVDLGSLRAAADVSTVVLACARSSTRAAPVWLAAVHDAFQGARLAAFRSTGPAAERLPTLPGAPSAACAAIVRYTRWTCRTSQRCSDTKSPHVARHDASSRSPSTATSEGSSW